MQFLFFLLFKANKFGFKPIMIDPLSHPLLCSQLLKSKPSAMIYSKISLYSIDCARKILQACHYTQADIYSLLDRARLAEASEDVTFWDQPYEVKLKQRSLNIFFLLCYYVLEFIKQDNK